MAVHRCGDGAAGRVERGMHVPEAGVDERRSGRVAALDAVVAIHEDELALRHNMTRPGCECQGNRTPGWTVNLTTAIRDASSMLTTSREWPLGLSRTCTETSSVNSCRCVSGSLAIGGGGARAGGWSRGPIGRRTAY